jgi:uncharacterized integral membrane protein
MMVKLTLFLLIVAASAILVLSNLSPVSLTFLGITTLALPLGIWVLGAIVAGALTTLLIALLVGSAQPVANYRPRQEHLRQDRPRQAAPRNSATRFWNADRQAPKAPSGSASSRSRFNNDDWESGGHSAAWDDWGEDEPLPQPPMGTPFNPSQSQPSRTEIRDREDEVWANWDEYGNQPEFGRGMAGGVRRPPGSAKTPLYERDVENRDRDLEIDFSDRPSRPVPPQRTEFEAPQEPETRYQSGSVYSYGFRRTSDHSNADRFNADRPEAGSTDPVDQEDELNKVDTSFGSAQRRDEQLRDDRLKDDRLDDRFSGQADRFSRQADRANHFREQTEQTDQLDELGEFTNRPPTPPTAKPGEVYDAEYRVIVPPYRPEPEEPSSSLEIEAPDLGNVDPADRENREYREDVSTKPQFNIHDFYDEEDDEDEDEKEIWDEDWS